MIRRLLHYQANDTKLTNSHIVMIPTNPLLLLRSELLTWCMQMCMYIFRLCTRGKKPLQLIVVAALFVLGEKVGIIWQVRNKQVVNRRKGKDTVFA